MLRLEKRTLQGLAGGDAKSQALQVREDCTKRVAEAATLCMQKHPSSAGSQQLFRHWGSCGGVGGLLVLTRSHHRPWRAAATGTTAGAAIAAAGAPYAGLVLVRPKEF